MPRALVVFDLNNVLVHRKRGLPFVEGSLTVHPDARDVLEWIFERFEVGIWSSMNPENTLRAVRRVFTLGQIDSLAFTFDQTRCDLLEEKGHYENKPDRPWFRKDLDKHVLGMMPWYNQNILFVDDNIIDKLPSGSNVKGWECLSWDPSNADTEGELKRLKGDLEAFLCQEKTMNDFFT